MNASRIRQILAVGETVAVEFKRCANGINADTYETVCAFLNRFGGDIFLGVEDNGNVAGLSAAAAPSLIKNFIATTANPEIFSPTVCLSPELVKYNGKTLIHIHVPPSSEVHRFKRVVYDRADDADVKITATSQIAAMYIRKQNIFTEKRIYPFVRDYDDRLFVQTNLIDSYDLLFGFAQKHLLDKFYLEGDKRLSLRDLIAREILVNTLIHREFTSSYIAKFVIWKDRMCVENACRASREGPVTPENLEPDPKNPTIAAFFRNIWLADELGSGTRNLYRYGQRYSGKPPQLLEGDIFRVIVPLDDTYSSDADMPLELSGKTGTNSAGNVPDILSDTADIGERIGENIGERIGENIGENITLNDNQKRILALLSEDSSITTAQLAAHIGIAPRNIESNLAKLKTAKLLRRIGPDKGGRWEVVTK
jgi:predicted HTH transcriptional regulator